MGTLNPKEFLKWNWSKWVVNWFPWEGNLGEEEGKVKLGKN